MKIRSTTLITALLCLITPLSFSQQKVNLADLNKAGQIKAVNRAISSFTKHAGAIEMDALEGDGLGILQEVTFDQGTLEIDLLGENNPGRSFIGIAFNIQNDKTFEAIYFRPFNFVSDEQIRKEHMVQYIYHPKYTWHSLREERTGEFENEIPVPPDPDNWFSAKIKVTETTVEVFVNDITEPVLKVDRLAEPKSQKIGVWAGNGSSGTYRNLVLLNE